MDIWVGQWMGGQADKQWIDGWVDWLTYFFI